MYITDNPVLDEMRHSAELEENLNQLPICEDCEEHIQDEGAYFINNKWYCQKCIKEYWRWID